MIKRVTLLGAFGVLMFSFSGCIPSGNRCFPYMQNAGYFCYKAYNYGRNVTPEFKKGVRDGCTTGEGRFRRDYTLSSGSAEYRSGWDAGRTKCKLITPEEAKPGLRTQYQQAIDEKKRW
jgi:hypothetical protein